LDLNLGLGNLGRYYGRDNRCTAGWNRHPHVAGLCVDSALDINLFDNERQSDRNGVCPSGYKRDDNILDLCLAINLGNSSKPIADVKANVAQVADVKAKVGGGSLADVKAVVGDKKAPLVDAAVKVGGNQLAKADANVGNLLGVKLNVGDGKGLLGL